MLTDYQRQLFSKLVDLNWEISQEYPKVVKTALNNEYWRIWNLLLDEMGEDKFIKYLEGMRQMFAPAS